MAEAEAAETTKEMHMILMSPEPDWPCDMQGGCHDWDNERAQRDEVELGSVVDLVRVSVDIAKIAKKKKKKKGRRKRPKNPWGNEYEPVDVQDILTTDEWRRIPPSMPEDVQRKYFQVLRRKKSTPADGAAPKSPKWVVVITGTNPMSLSDISKDMQITWSTMDTSPVVSCLQIVVERLVEIARSDPEKPKLVLAGHSLGASLDMFRKIVLQAQYGFDWSSEGCLFGLSLTAPTSMIHTVVIPVFGTNICIDVVDL